MSATTPPLEQRLLDVVALLEAQLEGARCAVLVGGIDRPDSPWSRSVLHDSGAVLGILEVNPGQDREPSEHEQASIAWSLDVIRLAFGIDQLEQEARERLERVEFLSRLVASVDQGLIATDSAGEITFWNAAAERILGWPADEVIHRLVPASILGGFAASDRDDIAAALHRGESWSGESSMSRQDGVRVPVAVTHAPILDAAGTTASTITSFTDISRQRAVRDAFEYRSTHDPLTGLANRSALTDEIARSLHSAQRARRFTGVLLMDLDRFTVVNDSLGHEVGDELLKLVSRRLRAAVRASDLVARTGGDEFAVIMREVHGIEPVLRAAERLVDLFRHPFLIHEVEVYATASIGVAMGSDPDRAADLIREADTALFAAKDQGRDQVSMFKEDLHEAFTDRWKAESQLRHALANDELTVWFQPEINLGSGSLIAVEALLRWKHPNGKTLNAESFITLAEETGLIHDIGRWVLDTACVQAAAWAAERPDLRLMVRVNLSALELLQPDLLETIDRALSRSGLDPSLLGIEITETALLRDTPGVRRNLAGLRERGIEIALDDFGTGYASLSYLRTFPIDLIKIDRSFIAAIATDTVDSRLVGGIIALAEILGIAVTAEGVERQDQANLLRELGCERAQGYLYSRAVPARGISELLAS